MNNILEVHTGLPPPFNKNLISLLSSHQAWYLSTDQQYLNLPEAFSDTGFLLKSYSINEPDYNNSRNSNINEIANLIFKVVLDTTSNYKFTNIKLYRFLWNYYNRCSTGVEHQDMIIEDGNFCSIVYYLNNNDGGTVIEGKFIPSVESNAVIFNARKFHKGIGPLKSKDRFCLNILFRYDELIAL